MPYIHPIYCVSHSRTTTEEHPVFPNYNSTLTFLLCPGKMSPFNECTVQLHILCLLSVFILITHQTGQHGGHVESN